MCIILIDRNTCLKADMAGGYKTSSFLEHQVQSHLSPSLSLFAQYNKTTHAHNYVICHEHSKREQNSENMYNDHNYAS